MLRLRTKEMRERDEKLRQYKYKYSLLKVRLPGRYVLQVINLNIVVIMFSGYFWMLRANECSSRFHQPIFGFKSSRYCMEIEGSHVQLSCFQRKRVRIDPIFTVHLFRTIGALGLAPAAILHFEAE